MPIYEYRCNDCGKRTEVLQKVADAPLTDCPSCNHPSLVKLVSAAGFQLKGTGWYATDFRGGQKPAESKTDGAETKSASADGAAAAAPACGAGGCPACK